MFPVILDFFLGFNEIITNTLRNLTFGLVLLLQLLGVFEGFNLMDLPGSRPSIFGLRLAQRVLPVEALKSFRLSPEKQRRGSRAEYPPPLKDNVEILKRE